AKRMPALQLDKLCRSYENVQAYDQAHRVEAGAMAAAQVAAQRTVTRLPLDNGMVKFEVVLPSDEAAIVWAALNAATAKAGTESTPAEPTPAEHSPNKLRTVDGSVSMRLWTLSRIARVVLDPSARRSKSLSPCRTPAYAVPRNRQISP
ncbi:MAG: hypothetical protein KBG15_14395, partial [Kofleriaceae bacterium]|nr:hypothetical protein [Kofleriaceae bacterium]